MMIPDEKIRRNPTSWTWGHPRLKPDMSIRTIILTITIPQWMIQVKNQFSTSLLHTGFNRVGTVDGKHEISAHCSPGFVRRKVHPPSEKCCTSSTTNELLAKNKNNSKY